MPALGSISSELNDRWMAYAWMESNDPINSFKQYDIWAKKMSYVRINSVRLGYTLPPALSKKIGASNLRVNVEGRNLFVFGANYEGYLIRRLMETIMRSRSANLLLLVCQQVFNSFN